MIAGCLLAAAMAVGEFGGGYADSAFPPATRKAEAGRLREGLDGLHARVRWLDGRLDAAFGALPTDVTERVRAEKRRLLLARALDWSARGLARGDATGLGFAEQSLADAREICRMLEEELAEWAVAPRAANAPVVLDVRDYGAKGDGVTDDAPAFVRACAAVRALGGRPSVLRVTAGTYRLSSVQTTRRDVLRTPRGLSDPNPWIRRAYGLFEGLENCRIEGDGPTNTILRAGFHGQQVALAACRNTHFRGFGLTMERIPFLEGEIESFDAATRTCVIRLDEGTLRPDDPTWTPTETERRYGARCIGVEYGKDGRLMRNAALLPWDRKAFEDLGDGRWKITIEDRPEFASYVRNVKPGGKLVLPNRTNAYGAFAMWYCTGCTVEDAWVRASRSSAFCSVRSARASFVRCRDVPLPGRSLSSNADGCFVDPGAFVWQCRFENMCDDGLNVKSYGSWAAAGDGPGEIRQTIPLTAGGEDVLAFFDPRTARYLGNRTPLYGESVVWTGSNGWRRAMRFMRPLDGLRVGESIVHGPRLLGVGTYIGSCAFRNGRLAGCVVQSPCTLVEDVSFEDIQGEGVRLGALGDYLEGPPPYNVLVRGCRMDDCRVGISAWLRMRDRATGAWQDPQGAPMRGLEFVGNDVRRAQRAAYEFSNAGDIRFAGNGLDGRPAGESDVKTKKVEDVQFWSEGDASS